MKRTIRRQKKEDHIPVPLGPNLIKRYRDEFEQKPENLLIQNALLGSGQYSICINQNEAKKTDYRFVNTIKTFGTCATNQSASGRCWLFAGLNMYRHFIIRGMGIPNFEFSANYLFFFDKLERANYFLNEMLEEQTLGLPNDDRYLRVRLTTPLDDGGHFSTFRDLVNKYGVVPKRAMPETFHSQNTDGMNLILNKILRGYAWKIRRDRKTMTDEEIEAYRTQTLQQIFDGLVKFLGTPPEEFIFSFTNPSGEVVKLANVTPEQFTKMALSQVSPNDYVVLAHAPNKEFGKVYEIQDPGSRMNDYSINKFLNRPIADLKKASLESIIHKFPVWFICDISKTMHFSKQIFDDKMLKLDLVFGPMEQLPKEDRLKFFDEEGDHAMVLIGVDLDQNNNPVRWQVENSWGYTNDEIPGLDGFCVMSDDWFDEHVYQVVVNSRFLTPEILKQYEQEPIKLDYFDEMTSAFRCK